MSFASALDSSRGQAPTRRVSSGVSANRLAHHYLLHELNRVRSTLAFLYFVKATEMGGPEDECEWRGAIRLLHAALGLPSELRGRGVFEAFVDVRQLSGAV